LTIASIALAISGIQGTIALTSLRHTLSESEAREHGKQITDWQQVIVFKIIADNSENQGIKANQILEKYRNEAKNFEERSHITLKEQLTEASLRYVLLDLMASNLIYRHEGDAYSATLSIINPRGLRVVAETQAKYAVLEFLSTEFGKYTVSDLAQKIQSQENITPSEFNKLVNELMADNYVLIDSDGKVYPAAKPPPGRSK
jgi:hypothetical protein